MYLEKIILINYQSCKIVELDILKDDPTVLIGINDSGKSTILKAIDILFEGKTQFNFYKAEKIKNDISNTRIHVTDCEVVFEKNNIPLPYYNERQCFIIGKLKVEDDDFIEGLENIVSTHLLWVLENSKDNYLWLMKTFDETETSSKDYLQTVETKQKESSSFWSLSAKELTQLRKTHGVTNEEVENENKAGRFKNIEQIRALYSKFDTELMWSEYSEKDRKKDKFFFPEISYLDWNFSFQELTNFTTSIMNQSINNNLQTARSFANEEAKKAQLIIDNSLDEIADYLGKEIPTIKKIKSNIIFDVQSKITDLILNKSNTDQDIHVESQGDGIKRQIWFAMIKWKALKTLEREKNNKKLIWCFDEPETHLYPAAQRDFFDKIKSISIGNAQTIISTHSTIFIDRAKINQIKKVSLNDSYSSIDACSSSEDVFESLKMRNSDFLFYDKFIVVEGSTDYYLVPILFKIITGKSLLDCSIQMIPLNGENNLEVNKIVLKNILKEFRKPDDRILYIFDNDINIKYGVNAFKDENVFFMGKQDIEDSIETHIWMEFVNDKLSKNNYEFQINANEIDVIKNEIPTDTEINENQKFYKKLQSLIRTKIYEISGNYIEILPSKGETLAVDLSSFIKNREDIPVNLVKALEVILKHGNN